MTRVLSRPGVWSFVAQLPVWLATIAVTAGVSTGGQSQAASTFGAFPSLAGIGQLFVITPGPGNIDLSVPATMSSAVALKFMDT